MNTATEGTEETTCALCKTIPVSHLVLDVPEPLVGWSAFFRERRVEVAPDDVGRPSIPRHVLGELVAEHREHEARQAERPRLDSVPVPHGIPRPAGVGGEAMTAFEVMRGADADAERDDPGRRVKPTEEFLSQLGRPRSVEVEEKR